MKRRFRACATIVWGVRRSRKPDFLVAEPLPHLKLMDEYLASLDPKTPVQKQFAAAAAANAGIIEQTRILISLQLGESHLLASRRDRAYRGR